MEQKNNDVKKISILILGIVIVLLIVATGTLAYYMFSTTNNTAINGTAAKADLNLTVSKTLPTSNGIDNIVLAKYEDIPAGINARCASGSYAMCQLYTITLTNNAANTSVTVNGSVSFTNTTAPNLSWILLSNYSSSTSYTSSDLPNSYNTASSTFTNFVSNETVNGNQTKTYYLLVWVNDIEEEQTDNGSYTGTVRFVDADGNGVTSTFNS